jgi:hypothetical protein
MAKKKIEGTEEETPKTRKEIRQERRQMKAVNAGRKEMGGDELYTKKEIRDVNKPFEPQASEVLTGTKQGVGNSSTTYNEPNKPAEKEYEYQKTGLSSRMGDREVVKATPVTAKQFTALNADDPNTGEAVKKVLVNNIVSDNNTSLEEKQKLIEATNVVKTEVNKTDEQINNQTKEEEKIISTTDPNAIAGSGASVAGVMDKSPAGPEWTSVVPTGQQYQAPSREEIYEQARQAKSKAPQLAIEKLGLQDYYPEAGRNIAVGTFTGSRIGSQTIYSGAGGLLPLGLYDARKRAIATEIKKKEAIMDQLKEMPDIAKQFKPYYSEKYMDFLSPWMDAFKDKPEELMRNTDFLKGLRQQQAIGENFLKVDADLKEFEALINPGDKGAEKGGYGAYATPAMLEILHKFKAGMLPGKIEEWFDGSKNISDLTKTVQAMPSGYKWADETVETLLKEGEAEIPIYPKDGVNWRDPKVKEAAMKDVNGLVVSLKDGSPDYETYLTSLKKYFSFDFETMTKEWIEGNSLNALTDKEKEEYKKSLTAYMLSKMPPDSIVNKVEMQANQAAKRAGDILDAQTAANKLAFEKEQAKFDRENSQVLKDVQSLLSGDKTSETVQHKGVETTGHGLNYNYDVIMDGTNVTKKYTGAQIIAFQKQGRTFTGDDGQSFNVPETVTLQPYETKYMKSGNRVIGRTRINAYTTGGTDEAPTSKRVNAIIELPDREYTNPDGSFNKANITMSDQYNYSKGAGTAAQGTEGGVTGTSTTTYRRNP